MQKEDFQVKKMVLGKAQRLERVMVISKNGTFQNGWSMQVILARGKNYNLKAWLLSGTMYAKEYEPHTVGHKKAILF